MNWFEKWWANHVQKTMASLLLLIDGVNVAALEFYHQDIVKILGEAHGESIFSGLRMTLAAIIGIRAIRRKQTVIPPPAPEATR